MQIQSINQITQKDKTYSSKPNNKVEYKLNQSSQIKDEFASTNKSQKEISFGYSIEYYAKRFLHSSNFDEALRSELWDNEVNFSQAIGDFFTNKATNRVNNMFYQVKSRIKELLKDIADEAERLTRQRTRLMTYDYDAEIRSINTQKEEMTKTLKVEGLAKKREQIKLEKNNLDIEEKDLNLEKELVLEQKLSDYTDDIKTKFINKVQLEKEEGKNKNNSPSKLTFPNGIMLSGLDNDINNELIQWTVKKTGCELKKVDFANLTESGALNELNTIAKNAKETDKRTIIHIKNIEKFATPTQNNAEIIPKLKNFLQKCAGEYKCTVITDVKDPSKLASAITADQRFEVIVKADS